MKSFFKSLVVAFALSSIFSQAGFAQMGYPTHPRDCDTYLSWQTNAQGNRGNLGQSMRPPTQTWLCQAKGVGQPDAFYAYSFYDINAGIAYDHSQYRCERELQRCEVRCAFVPISCIPY